MLLSLSNAKPYPGQCLELQFDLLHCFILQLEELEDSTRATVETINKFYYPLMKAHTACHSMKLMVIAANGAIQGMGEYRCKISGSNSEHWKR